VVLDEILVHFVCNIFVCACSIMGGGCGIHVSNDCTTAFACGSPPFVVCE